MRYHHDQHIGVYENAISDEWCDEVINYFETNLNKSSRKEYNTGNVNDPKDHRVLLKNDSLIKTFTNSIDICMGLYKEKYPQINDFPLTIWDFQIQKTNPTEGYHRFHAEHGPSKEMINRIAVYTLYLNTIEEGGETEFLYQLKRVNPKKGTLCIFPASYTHTHRGNTPFSNEKYILTGWFEVPPLPQTNP